MDRILNDEEENSGIFAHMDEAREYLEKEAEEGAVPGAAFCAVARRECRTVYLGKCQLVPEVRPLKKGALFDLASLTKAVFTTTAALQCMDRGLFALKTPVADLLPGFRFPSVRIVHLLTHTSGLVPDDKKYRSCQNNDEMIRFILDHDLVYEPGTEVRYSDFGFILLGEILRRLVGDLDDYGEEFIFAPLHMEDTFFRPEKHQRMNDCVPTECTAERGVIRGVVHDGKAFRMGGISGHAGLFSTAEDLGQFVRMLLGGGIWEGCEILSPSSMGLLHRSFTEQLNAKRTLGWMKKGDDASPGDWAGEDCLYHTGFTGTSVYVDFERECGIVLLTNRVHPSRDNDSIGRIRANLHSILLRDA